MKDGFTLIELLVVVLIIGILAAAAVPQYQKTVRKTRMMAELIPAMRSLKAAEERYYLANSSYTNDFESLDITIPLIKILPCVMDGRIFCPIIY